MNFLPIEKNGNKVYAGFLKRFGAGIVDMLVFILFYFLFQYLEGISIPVAIITVLITSTLFSTYTVYFHYRFGATLGKLAVGIKVTLPDGSRIGLQNALLRSSVEIGFAMVFVVAKIIAISNADPQQYLAVGWFDRAQYIVPLYPAWFGAVNAASQLWYWSEFFVLLFNKRKRAIHDFIAGTVVINKRYAEQDAQVKSSSAFQLESNC